MKYLSFVFANVVLATSLIMLSNQEAHAQSKNRNFSGISEIITQCVVSTKQKYAQKICDSLSKSALNLAEKSGVDLTYLGINSNFELTENTSAQPPLQLIFYVRGTSGRNVGASVRIVAGVHFAAAVEKTKDDKSPQHPTLSRQGLLVLWEQAAVGEGSSSRMPRAISAHMIKKMRKLFALIGGRE